MKAIVAGAGLAGLTAGYALKKAGWQVTVLESSGYAGGRAATVVERGYTIDLAATQLTAGYHDYLALCRDFNLDREVEASSPIAAFIKNGELIEIDSSKLLSAALSPLLSLGSKFTLLKTVLDKRAINPPVNYLDISASFKNDDETIKDYCLRRLNSEIYDYLVSPIMKGNFLFSPDNVSKLEWFAFLENFASQTMLAIPGGAQRLPECLARELDVRLNAPAVNVQQEGDQVRVEWQESGLDQSETVDACVVATRLPEAIKICPAYRELAAEFNSRLYYSKGVVVHLGYAKQTESKAIGIFVPDKEEAQIALVWLDHNKLPVSAPPGHSLITCYMNNITGDQFNEMDDQAFIGKAAGFLQLHFPELEGHLDLTRVSRWPLAIPFPEPGAHTALHQLKQRLSPESPIQFAGDYFTVTGQNSAIHYGHKAAETLLRKFG